MSNLNEIFLDELKDIYDAEKQLVFALPKMTKAAQNDELREGFERHLEETQTHVQRLEEVFGIFGETPKGKSCKAMEGLIKEGSELIAEDLGDAALICAAQKIEHYEIASYGTLVTWARLLGKDDAADILEETLGEERTTDETLTDIAETAANPQAESEEAEPQGRKGTSKSRT